MFHSTVTPFHLHQSFLLNSPFQLWWTHHVPNLLQLRFASCWTMFEAPFFQLKSLFSHGFSHGFPINPPFSPRSPGFGSQNGAGLLPFDGAGRRGQARGAGGPAGGAAADHGGGASVGDVWERRKNWCINVYNIYISIYLSTYLPIYLSTYLRIYLSTYLSIYLFGYI